MRSLVLSSLLACLVASCSSPSARDDAGSDDAGRDDVGSDDAGSDDAGSDDAGRNHAGSDAGPPDAGNGSDGGEPDGGGEENPDAGTVPEDAGTDETDAGTSDELPTCPVFTNGSTTGLLLDLRVREASGVLGGRRNPGILWVHNDSGGNPEIFAITEAGQARGKFTLDGADFKDWEDIAAGPGPESGQNYLYLGDIGDNGTSRSTIKVYRVAEPQAGTATTAKTLQGVERFTFEYPDHAHNAETLLVDPRTGDLFVVVKASDGVTPVFRAAAPLQADQTTTLEQVALLQFDGPDSDSRLTTAGDISPSGDEIAIRTYHTAFVWRRLPGASVADALTTEPCPIPLADEGQGEALGYRADGTGYFTLGEGQLVGLHFYERP